MINYIKLGIAVGILALVGVCGFVAFKQIKDIGYKEAQAECQALVADLEKKRDERTLELQATISAVTEAVVTQNQLLTKDVTRIVSGLRRSGEPTTIIKEGKCTPSPTYVNSLNEAIEKVNSGASSK